MPGAPYTSWLTLGFLLVVLVMIGFDYPNGTYTLLMIPVIAIALMWGWSRTAHVKNKKPEGRVVPEVTVLK
ncbi:hypothetical protein D3C81_2318610 [compost metagenome]